MRTSIGNTRRRFLAASAAAVIAPNLVRSTAFADATRPGANDRISVGVIGCGVRGKYLISNLPEEADVVALCDCSLDRIESVRNPDATFAPILARFVSQDAPRCAIEQDYRRLIAETKLDAVVIATPDHHHVLAAILACQAGLDVYCEKPLTLTIGEGRHLVDAVRDSGRILQVGSQQRTMEVNRFGCEFVRGGGLGRVERVQLRNYPGPMRLNRSAKLQPSAEGSATFSRPPESMHWDLFCGPTELVDYDPDLWIKDDYERDGRLWRGWDLFRRYSGHLMTNWGGHGVDMIQYALGKDDTGPVELVPRVDELNASLLRVWDAKTPSSYPGLDPRASLMRVCPVTMKYADGVSVEFTDQVDRIVFHGERGRMLMGRNHYRTEPADLAPPMDQEAAARWQGSGHVARPHLQNWLDCMRSRDQPNAPVEAGHRTATACHLANLARELGRSLRWDPISERFVNDTEANQLINRPRRAGFELPIV